MKLALIPPLAQIRYAERCNYHLVLSHLLDNTDAGIKYAQFYKHLLRNEHYIILDNAAHERPSGEGIADTLRKASLIGGAHEIVMPDKQQHMDLTIRRTDEAVSYLATGEGHVKWFAAGHPRLMYVPQGKNWKEWQDCFYAMIFAHSQLREMDPTFDYPVIGVAKKHAMLFPIQWALKLLRDWRERMPLAIHLLGWTSTRDAISGAHYGARSMDTAKPFVYAIHDVDISGLAYIPEVHRPVDYFRHTWDLDHTLLTRNIDWFKDQVEKVAASHVPSKD